MADLINAAKAGDVQRMRVVLHGGATVDARALMEASSHGHAEAVLMLLERGADVNAASSGGWTALMGASCRGHAEVATLLLERGANVNAAKDDNSTALNMARINGHTELAELLQERGAYETPTPSDDAGLSKRNLSPMYAWRKK